MDMVSGIQVCCDSIGVLSVDTMRHHSLFTNTALAQYDALLYT
jgi:hypothetical protein